MTPEKIAVLVITGVIAVLLSLTLMESSEGAAPRPQTLPPQRDQAEPVPSIEDLMKGNGTTILRPPPQKPVDPELGGSVVQPPVRSTYVVQSGDTMEKIALKLLGSRAAHRRLLDLNPNVNPRTLKPGQELIVPGGSSKPAPKSPTSPSRTTDREVAATPAITPKETPAKVERSHTVKAGETLSSIARTVYGKESAWKRILEANQAKLRSPDRLAPGMVLRLP